MEPRPAAKPSATARRKAARLMAVQALYQMSVNKKEPVFVIDEYLYLRKNMTVDGETMVEPDADLFRKIVHGVVARGQDLQDIVVANRNRRAEQESFPDEPLLNAILLCGAYELLEHGDLDAALIISSYIEVARAFFSGQEPGLVHGVLDGIRKVVRD
jgi:N utilization substance protein B